MSKLDRCTACRCTTLRDEAGERPMGVVGCGKACACHAPLHSALAVRASLAADAVRLRARRPIRAAETGRIALS